MVEETMRPFMEEVMDVMEKNYDNSEFGVQELADALGISRSVLSKNLSKETGLPTAQFIRNYRLDISRKMMADKNFQPKYYGDSLPCRLQRSEVFHPLLHQAVWHLADCI